ncbi:MAG: HAD family hydrolase [Planctomycetota bacterium]
MKRLLFDIDGTLLETHGSGADALRQTMIEEFKLENPNTEIAFGGRTDRSIAEELLRINGLPIDLEHRNRLFDAYSDRLPTALSSRGGRVLPGVIELLETLRDQAKDFPLDVMTGNLAKTARMKLEHFDLLSFFGEVHGGDLDVCRDAMARRSAERIESHCSLPLVVIGDTVADIRCGRAINAHVIAVATGSASRQALLSEAATGTDVVVFDSLASTDEVMGWISQK